MPRRAYIEKSFQRKSMEVIHYANQICAEYARQGYDLTLRQLYYQFVSRDLIANSQKEYNKLGSIVNDARMAGLMDWDYIVDRTRNLEDRPHWNDPIELIGAAARGYNTPHKWDAQDYRVEVWIEKDALVGVLESCCPEEDVPFFSCRGYTSQSEVWGAAQRLGSYIEKGQKAVIIHLGDHDPSGMDMTRDIRERLERFIAQDIHGCYADEETWAYADAVGDDLIIDRIALNYDQVERYNPPPNPAKLTDTRASGYISTYGYSSWELDALEPTTLVGLIRDQIDNYRDAELWEKTVEKEEKEREILTATSERWDEVVEFLEKDKE